MLCFTQVIKEKVPGKYPITFDWLDPFIAKICTG